MPRKTRTCGFCKKREMVPCGNSRDAAVCPNNRKKKSAYEIANNRFHPLRLGVSIALMQYHADGDEQGLLAELESLGA